MPTGSGRALPGGRRPVSGSPRAGSISARAIGTLTTKTARQPKASTSAPPSGGPTTAAKLPAADQAPIAAPIRSRGVTARIRPSAAGIISAAAAPCATRPAIRVAASGASPHSSEVSAKAANAIRNSLRLPRASAKRPAGVSRAAKATP